MAISSPQQLNLADRIAVRRNLVPRCAAAVANYALYIMGEDPGTANHVNRLNWATNAILIAESVGDQVSWQVLNQTSYLNGGSSIDDSELTGIVENVINSFFITPA